MIEEKHKAEKKKNKKQVKKKEKTIDDIQNQQVRWVIVFIIATLLIVAGTYYFIESSRKFNFMGLPFEKVKYGNLVFYHTNIEITKTNQENNIIGLFLRKDPRKNNVPLDANIRYKINKITYISTGMDFNNCEYANVALINLGRLLNEVGIPIMGATTDINHTTNSLPYMTCENKENTVILLKNSTRTYISQEENCYIIEVKDCEILEATERFMLGTIAHSQGKSL